jgi:hypothetical protein
MTQPNALIVENGYATIALPGGQQITTTRLHTDRYVRIDDGNQYPQLCVGAQRMGNTLIYHDDERLARACRAKLYKTRRGFDAAARTLAEAEVLYA